MIRWDVDGNSTEELISKLTLEIQNAVGNSGNGQRMVVVADSWFGSVKQQRAPQPPQS